MTNINTIANLREKFEMEKVDIRTYSPLTLAYIGDAVFDLVIRSLVVMKGNTSNNNLHKSVTKYVSAIGQGRILDKIAPVLTEEELGIYRRGKNAKPNSKAKNATLAEYLKATGFEALIGYLYLKGDEDRMIELIRMGISNE